MHFIKTLFICIFVSVASFSHSEASLSAVSKCPLSGKCPYVANFEGKASSGSGCPLSSGKCPYYTAKKDGKLPGLLTEPDSKCPLAGKCSFYKDIKAGKEVDLSGSACPLKGKCPYYADLKNNKTKADSCPLEHACPHFKKDFEKGGKKAHRGDVKDAHDSKRCPYLHKEGTKKEQTHSEL
ncbi:hypothetical protein BC829DRAFT_396700 [Chytridium lagenaria]|nr:hypothetical protein BC829DRAFT_396700 [Chytridium lagenaria]